MTHPIFEPGEPTSGVNQARVRDHNERLVLSLIQRHGGLPGSEIARRSGLSPQTVSVILRSLERDGFVQKGKPQRGRVGKPGVPMLLSPDGVLSVGLKIGRRSAELTVMDFLGRVRVHSQINYAAPVPDCVFGFLKDGLDRFAQSLTPKQRQRILGIGIAAPYEIWNWHESMGAPREDLEVWRDLSFANEIAKFSALPVHVENDATAACRAEHVFGVGPQLGDFGYFFVGSFIGGGIVLNRSVYDGPGRNAGAFGSLPIAGPDGRRQLIDLASIYLLEKQMRAMGLDPVQLWNVPQDWSGFEPAVAPWIKKSACAIAQGIVAVSGVIDFRDFVIDGAFPPQVRARLVSAIRADLARQDLRGLTLPRVHEGAVGANARAIGAAAVPIYAQFLLNSHAAWA
ncbi:ROK family transcriptional regulator [Oceaniglobus ichthyenteri]|uniref:ROK family transcriptional regulator n=1 Tax=Oceaniglobus ichthyenteri TaxID=2136177 RepID=UPI001F0CBD79|nr:ROK family transcriptional regulator [Oceaniglobus ichthyenteri]